MSLPLIIVLMFALLTPIDILGGNHAHWRLMLPFFLIFFGSFYEPSMNRRTRRAVMTVVFVLALAQTHSVNTIWRKTLPVQEELLVALDALPPRSSIAAVFPYTFREAEGAVELPFPFITDALWTHLPALGVVRSDHFIPSLFAFETQQPLFYRPPHAISSEKLGILVFPGFAEFDWQTALSGFEYILIMDYDGDVGAWLKHIPVPYQEMPGSTDKVVIVRVSPPGS